jgi:hypothetical protein
MNRTWRTCVAVVVVALVTAACVGVMAVLGHSAWRFQQATALERAPIDDDGTLQLRVTLAATPSPAPALLSSLYVATYALVDAQTPVRAAQPHVAATTIVPPAVDGCVRTAGLLPLWRGEWFALDEWTVQADGTCLTRDTACGVAGLTARAPDLQTWPVLGCGVAAAPVTCGVDTRTVSVCVAPQSTRGVPAACGGVVALLNESVADAAFTLSVSTDASGRADITLTAAATARFMLAVNTSAGTVSGTNELWPPEYGVLARTVLRVTGAAANETVDVTVTPVGTTGSLTVYQAAHTRTACNTLTLPPAIPTATVDAYATAAILVDNAVAWHEAAASWYLWEFADGVPDGHVDVRVQLQLSAVYAARVLAVNGLATNALPLTGLFRVSGYTGTRLTLLVSHASGGGLVLSQTGTVAATIDAAANATAAPLDLPANSRSLFNANAVRYYMRASSLLHVKITVRVYTEGLAAQSVLVGVSSNASHVGLAALPCCTDATVVLSAETIATHRFTGFRVAAVNGGHAHVTAATLGWAAADATPDNVETQLIHAIMRPHDHVELRYPYSIMSFTEAGAIVSSGADGWLRGLAGVMASECASVAEKTAINTTLTLRDTSNRLTYVPFIRQYATETTGTIQNQWYIFGNVSSSHNRVPDAHIQGMTCAADFEVWYKTADMYFRDTGLAVSTRAHATNPIYALPLAMMTIVNVTSVSTPMNCPSSGLYCGFLTLMLATGNVVVWPPDTTIPSFVYWPRTPNSDSVTGLVWIVVLEDDLTLGAAIAAYTNSTPPTIAERQLSWLLTRAVHAHTAYTTTDPPLNVYSLALADWTLAEVTADTRVLQRDDVVLWSDNLPAGLPPDP